MMSTRSALLGTLLTVPFLVAGGVAGRPVDSAAEASETLVYGVEKVQRKVFRETGHGDETVAAGAELAAGDVVRTGWRSTADLAVPSHGARFHLGSRTRVRLAQERPGVLLELERGRLRTFFDALLGDEPPERRVTTPSAILAVRGTEYGVQVDGGGHTTVVVFRGVVEVFGLGMPDAVRVEAGSYVVVHRGHAPSAPRAHRMNTRSWDRGHMPAGAGLGMGSGSMGSGLGGGGLGGPSSRGGTGGGMRGGSRRHGG